ncbi:hypothetical protein G6F57_019939 [Rhizopus arrhizus]|nr:hypothetical protein G6F57_019939 [Rhizopus arrhizus]
MRGIALARRREVQRLGLGLGAGNQFVQRTDPRLRAGDEQEGRIHQQADAVEIPRRLIRHVLVHMRVEGQVRHPADQHRVPIGRLLGHSAHKRPITSVPPPAACGTTSLMGLAG